MDRRVDGRTEKRSTRLEVKCVVGNNEKSQSYRKLFMVAFLL